MASSATKDIARHRVRAQLLARTTTLARPAEVVGHLGAVQAQDYAGALWAIGVRLAGARATDVERAIEERTLVRTWPMRGTLHFVASADARWMVDLLAPRAAAGAASRLRSMGIDERVVSRARRTLEKQLEGGRRLTRPAAYRALEQTGISTRGERGLHVLWRLAHDGVLCLGPREGKQPTLVLLEEWLPGAKRLPRDEALAELARRYFTSHGPATDRDFAWWSGLTLADARPAIDSAGKALKQETLAGQPHWFATSFGGRVSTRSTGLAHALPPYDELLVGYADRTAALQAPGAVRLTPFDVLGPVVVVDGQVVATWRRPVRGRRAACSISWLTSPSKARTTRVGRALGLYARFFGFETEGPR
ncbi:MAG TPA: winged helix DNA-binding domain-containing protein [Polyangiaceae bacterium]|nr:winged helix DNA-binding domain-containing protein [Polyangiaceae bacterium]